MSLQLKLYGLVGAGLVGFYTISMTDRGMNYVETEARVIDSKVDCFVKAYKSKLIEKSTGKMAYMDCKLAPIAAEMHGYSKSDIRQRVQFTYEYVSPVDGSRQRDKHTAESNVERYGKGKTFTVYAHKEDPAKSRIH